MAQILDKQGLQHYANKMCNADNRKVGSKNLPTALNEIDIAIDGFKTLFESEYGTPVNMELTNNQNMFTVGTSTDIDKKDDVENSFTDLKMGGNTLVNLMPKITSGDYIQLNATTNWVTSSYHSTGKRLKPNTKYTVILDVHANSLSSTNNFHVNIDHKNAMAFTEKWTVNSLGRHVKLFTTKAELLDNMLAPRTQIETAEEGKYVRYSIILLEGDWTNKPIPQYFEGLKSIGEKEDGNHKISISSTKNGLNLIKNSKNARLSPNNTGLGESVLKNDEKDLYYRATPNSDKNVSLYWGIEPNKSQLLKTNKIVIYSIMVRPEQDCSITFYGNKHSSKMTHSVKGGVWTRVYTKPFEYLVSTGESFILVVDGDMKSKYLDYKELKIEYGEKATDWCPSFEEIKQYPKYLDEKEILLNEPLRGLPNGVKDTIEKINGEWKIIRRCRQDTLNGNSLTGFTVGAAGTSSSIGENVNRINFFLEKAQWSINKNKTVIVCNNFSYINFHATSNGSVERNSEAICFHSTESKYINLHILKSRLTEQTMAAARTWLNANPITVVYELENYIIEDIDPITLQCWKNGTISIDEVLPVETTHTVALNKSAQIQKNIEELTLLRNRVETLEKQYNNSTLNQAYELELLRLDMELDNIV